MRKTTRKGLLRNRAYFLTVHILLTAALLLWLSPVTAFAAHTAEIEISGSNRYKALRLAPQIYNAANSDLSDILIKDSSGGNVPYFINSSAGQSPSDEENDFIESLEPQFTIESGDRMTQIIIEGLKNLRLCDVTIHTGSMFKRDAMTPDGMRKEIYNLSINDISSSDTAIPLYWHVSPYDLFVIAIDDGDDTPIVIDGVTVRYYADDIVFEAAEGEGYTLEFGADPSAAPPVYDIQRYRSEILEGAIDSVSIGEISYAPEEPPEEAQPPRDYRLVFNIVVIVTALLLGVVIALKLRGRGSGESGE